LSAIQLLSEGEEEQYEVHKDDGQLGQVAVRNNSIHIEGPVKGTLTEREAPTENSSDGSNLNKTDVAHRS
jgi:hypothetical protein